MNSQNWRYFCQIMRYFKQMVMRRRIFLLAIMLISGCTTLMAEGYKIKLKLTSAADSSVYLTHYYDTNVYIKDTLLMDSRGFGVFEGDTLLPEGLYKIYMNANRHFDVLLGKDQTMEITNPDFGLDHLQIKDAVESVEFLKYTHWLQQQQKKLSVLDSVFQKAGKEEKDQISKQIIDLTNQVHQYWKQKSAEFHGTMLAVFLMANYVEDVKLDDIPEAYKANDSLKWTYQYNFRKDHYFDHFDITDKRYIFTPLLKPKLEAYFDKVLLQLYDSVKPYAFKLIRKAQSEPLMFRYVASYLLNKSLNSNIMGMDALFVDIAREYYLSGQANWVDSASNAVIRENVIFLENNLIGMQARNLRMETLDGLPYFLTQGKNKYTILVFYEPTCSHCKEFVPKLYNDIFLPYRDKGLDVVAIYNQNNRKEWTDFIDQHHMTDWINVWDEFHQSRFKVIYDTRTTPAVFLLDADKKIIAKKFSIDFLKKYFGFHIDGKPMN